MTARHVRMRCGLLGLAVGLGGCVYSVEAVITESSATFDARLLGDWKEVGSSERAVVTRSAGNGYSIFRRAPRVPNAAPAPPTHSDSSTSELRSDASWQRVAWG